MGIVSSIGNDVGEVLQSLREAKSGISFAEDYAAHGFRCRVEGAPTLAGLFAGKPELIRQAEVSGKTISGVRVGPLAKGEATSLCTQLQGAGAPCFVAKN